jgi:hypothetical protein
MKPDPDKRTVLIEQWWIGCGVMLFWAVIIMGLTRGCARGAEVKLAWNPNPETDIAGYEVLVGLSPGSYTQTISTGNVTSFTLTGLAGGATYYISLVATDTAGNRSLPASEVVSETISDPPRLDMAGVTVHSFSSEETTNEPAPAVAAIDGDRNTFNGRIETAVTNARAAGANVTYWDTTGWIDPATDTADGFEMEAEFHMHETPTIVALIKGPSLVPPGTTIASRKRCPV